MAEHANIGARSSLAQLLDRAQHLANRHIRPEVWLNVADRWGYSATAIRRNGQLCLWHGALGRKEIPLTVKLWLGFAIGGESTATIENLRNLIDFLVRTGRFEDHDNGPKLAPAS